MGGFILGFDTDSADIFDRMVDFIEKSGIPIAMVGLLQAMPGTQLFRRLWKEGRILDLGHGDNTGDHLNFLPHMDATRLVEGYRSVLQRIYNRDAYYKRVKLYLSRTQPEPGEHSSQQRWLTHGNARALIASILRQGVFGRQRWSYWKFLMTAATRYRDHRETNGRKRSTADHRVPGWRDRKVHLPVQDVTTGGVRRVAVAA